MILTINFFYKKRIIKKNLTLKISSCFLHQYYYLYLWKVVSISAYTVMWELLLNILLEYPKIIKIQLKTNVVLNNKWMYLQEISEPMWTKYQLNTVDTYIRLPFKLFSFLKGYESHFSPMFFICAILFKSRYILD